MQRIFLHFFICVSIFSFQFKFSSSVTPRYFAVGLILISVLLHLKLFGFVIVLFLVQNMICVLTSLISRHLNLHHLLILFRYLLVVSRIVFMSEQTVRLVCHLHMLVGCQVR